MRDFNGTLKKAIDEAIIGVFGSGVHETLYRILTEKHSVTSDEVLYRLETLFEVLENGLGHVGSRTVSRSIARLFYSKLGLQFVVNPEWRLQDYVEEAKKNLAGFP